jgi:hypothetical protein
MANNDHRVWSRGDMGPVKEISIARVSTQSHIGMIFVLMSCNVVVGKGPTLDEAIDDALYQYAVRKLRQP